MSENCVACGCGTANDQICSWCGLHAASWAAIVIREARALIEDTAIVIREAQTLIEDIKNLPRFDLDVGTDDFKYGTKNYGKNGRFVDAYDLKSMIAQSGF